MTQPTTPRTKPDGTCFWHELPMGGKFGCAVCDQEIKEGRALITPKRIKEIRRDSVSRFGL